MHLPIDDLEIRCIKESDNADLANVIKTALEEQGNNKEGTIYTDPLLHKMHSGYTSDNTVYYVAIYEGKLIGGCGIAPVLNSNNNSCCELQRMFLERAYRGKGIGSVLMEYCLQFAQSKNYVSVYIETFSNMHEAIKLYKRSGFEYIGEPIGNTGHFSCDVFLLKKL